MGAKSSFRLLFASIRRWKSTTIGLEESCLTYSLKFSKVEHRKNVQSGDGAGKEKLFAEMIKRGFHARRVGEKFVWMGFILWTVRRDLVKKLFLKKLIFFGAMKVI